MKLEIKIQRQPFSSPGHPLFFGSLFESYPVQASVDPVQEADLVGDRKRDSSERDPSYRERDPVSTKPVVVPGAEPGVPERDPASLPYRLIKHQQIQCQQPGPAEV